MNPWPPFVSPGWLATYATGALTWFAIAELWGAATVLTLIAVGVLLIVFAARLLGGEIPSGGDEP